MSQKHNVSYAMRLALLQASILFCKPQFRVYTESENTAFHQHIQSQILASDRHLLEPLRKGTAGSKETAAQLSSEWGTGHPDPSSGWDTSVLELLLLSRFRKYSIKCTERHLVLI